RKEQQLGSMPPPPLRTAAYATSVTSACWHIIPGLRRPWTSGRLPAFKDQKTFSVGAQPTRLWLVPPIDPRVERACPRLHPHHAVCRAQDTRGTPVVLRSRDCERRLRETR
ncbi:hypothetical protein P7K49_039051, partial [Saguinus oedipus]